MIKILERSEMLETCINIIKAIKGKPTVKIKLNGETLKAIAFKSRTRECFPLSPYLFNIVLEVLARARRQQKEIKRIKIENDKVKLLFFADDMKVTQKILPENFHNLQTPSIT